MREMAGAAATLLALILCALYGRRLREWRAEQRYLSHFDNHGPDLGQR